MRGYGRGGDVRSPHALQSVRAPSGPRRHSGVSRMLHEWHLPGGVARCKLKSTSTKSTTMMERKREQRRAAKSKTDKHRSICLKSDTVLKKIDDEQIRNQRRSHPFAVGSSLDPLATKNSKIATYCDSETSGGTKQWDSDKEKINKTRSTNSHFAFDTSPSAHSAAPGA